MRVRIRSLRLEGTTRSVAFSPGLNIITGPIASGKTTLLQFARSLIGASFENVPTEARAVVTAVSGELVLGSSAYSVIRPAVATRTARVEIAGENEALRLPFAQSDREAPVTYVQWLLDRLDLPRLQVPSAPTRPESEPTPVTLSDYLLYCTLPQDEIGFSVFGHMDPFKNIKRKYVFEIIYGLYSIEMAQLQEELRTVQAQLRDLRGQDELFSKLLSGTGIANRAVLQRELEAANQDLQETESAAEDTSTRAVESSETSSARARVLELEARYVQLHAQIEAEQQAVRNLEGLSAQLETQIARLTRSIVAQKYLTDIDFVICPRCGAAVRQDRADGDKCYLCLQDPEPRVSRESLINEQARLEGQLSEARELLELRVAQSSELRRTLEESTAALQGARDELDFLSRTFISTEGSRIAGIAARRAGVRARVAQVRDYLRIHENLESARRLAAELEARREEITAALDSAATRTDLVSQRIDRLSAEFNLILERFRAPQFGEEVISSIDRRTFLPIYHGRRFDDLSSPGLGTLVTVAYMMAHHRTSIALGLRLPSIVFVDGLSTHLGEEGLDPERVQAVYEYLIETAQELGDELQLMIVDNEVPMIARQYVRLELSDSERLIPSRL